MVLQGKVEALESYGAFVQVGPNLRGLVHVSEMADRRVGHPRDVVAVGAEVRVVVLEVDQRRRRVRLSMKQVEAMEDASNLQEFQERQKKDQGAADSGTAMAEALKRARLIS
jgi:small subunit ribosomal protein S1